MDGIIHNYVQVHKPSICILTHCYEGNLHMQYMKSYLETVDLFKEFHIPVILEQVSYIDSSCKAKNNLIAKGMNKEHITHFMFIHPSTSWDPVDIIKLLLADKYIVGGICPLKKLDFDILSNDPQKLNNWKDTANKYQIKTPYSTIIQNNILKYDVSLLNNNIEIKNGISKVKYNSSNFLLCKRIALEKMQSAFPKSKYIDSTGTLSKEEQKHAYALFETGIINNVHYGEDVIFCERWNNMNGSIWANISINIHQKASHNYEGSFYNSIIQI